MSLLLKHIKVISRSSNLAIKQVEEVLSHFPGLRYTIIPVQSFGDKNKDISLFHNSEPDFFTRELDMALLKGETDIAIHSAKDLPYPLPKGLEVISLLESTDNTDAFVSRENKTLKKLKPFARIGTSSISRKNELLKLRSDLEIVSIRGTIGERINLTDNGQLDGVIVATCALKRLNLEHRISEILPFKTHPLQGNIAVVARSDNSNAKIVFNKIDIRNKYGTVYLVGFGPGDPELLTIKAFKVLSKADVIYYDDLISKEYIKRFNAEKIYVGKRKGRHSMPQDEINQLLYHSAIKGKTVVRLKGGDPMIFAHGGEEIGFLEQYLVKTEVIPGISSGIAAAGLTKIPLTYRGISSSVTFISGHNVDNLNIPESGTLVFYMSASTIKGIAEKLINKGWHPATPVAIIHSVSNSDQKECISTLVEIINSEYIFKTPSIIIVGDVVNLKRLNVRQIIKPVILVTGTDPSIYQKYGSVVHQPLINIKPCDDYTQVIEMLNKIHLYNWIIFTSKHTVSYFFDVVKSNKKDARILSALKVASIGQVTTNELSRNGIVPDLQADVESSKGLIEKFRELIRDKQNILLPRSDKALDIIPKGLEEAGHRVTPLILYRNEMIKDIEPVDLGKIDYIAFSSPSCVDSFMNIYKNYPDTINFIARGETTKTRMTELNIHPGKIILTK